ncbi:MAG: T9SS type A sorting domain-containing protein [Chitinophagaceae bacterium]
MKYAVCRCEYTKAAKATMRILDATGRVVLEEAIELGVGNSKASMNMSSLSDGMYMFVISNDKDINYTQTIRKQ